MKRFVLWFVVGVVAVAVAAIAALRFSPWPSVWLIRQAFDAGAATMSESIAALVPPGIRAERAIRYDPADADALLDVYRPPDATGPLPAVVWVHGDGFIAGSRTDLSNYLQILAARGFAVIGIDYTLAPEAQFPAPLRQANAALAFVQANAERLGVDPQRIFLAGDSAGAQIAAQVALILSDDEYARRLDITPGMSRAALRGTVLFCGPYDPASMTFDGEFGSFMRTAIWAYLGARDPHDARVAQLAVAPHVGPSYPPAFISVGNVDPLAPQSRALADALRAAGVEVDRLFFKPEHDPPLEHEYQLLLDTDAGKLALDRAVAFMKRHAAVP